MNLMRDALIAAMQRRGMPRMLPPVIGPGALHARARLVEKLEANATFYADAPLPKTGRQVARRIIRKAEKRAAKEAEVQVHKAFLADLRRKAA